MRQFSDYDLLIFDCDGVILDSNTLKINAMKKALSACHLSDLAVEECSTFFANNFGKSRFYHVDYFVENLLTIEKSAREKFKADLLTLYSEQCKRLYLLANSTPFVDDILTKSTAIKYVASGSEQEELNDVFQQRQLTHYFKAIFGSPEKKVNHVTHILAEHPKAKAVMIGDAVSDLEAAKDNQIDFIFYSPFSNVEEKMRALCLKYNYRILNSFEEVLNEL
jgi:phosphoglycolate phosphatase-like HAD superfamily hydrolase